MICWMHFADRGRLKVHPQGQEELPERGVFSTRSPTAPTPFRSTPSRCSRSKGTCCASAGWTRSGTTVVDIKPHSPELDG